MATSIAQKIAHYAYYGDLYGIATRLAGGWLFHEEG